MDEPLSRFQLNVLDYETSSLVDAECDKYILVYEKDGGLVVRTDGCDTKDTVMAMMSIKQLLYEALKKEISALRTFETVEEFEQLFNGVFTDMMRELLADSVEFKDGDTQEQVVEHEQNEHRFE